MNNFWSWHDEAINADLIIKEDGEVVYLINGDFTESSFIRTKAAISAVRRAIKAWQKRPLKENLWCSPASKRQLKFYKRVAPEVTCYTGFIEWESMF